MVISVVRQCPPVKSVTAVPEKERVKAELFAQYALVNCRIACSAFGALSAFPCVSQPQEVYLEVLVYSEAVCALLLP